VQCRQDLQAQRALGRRAARERRQLPQVAQRRFDPWRLCACLRRLHCRDAKLVEQGIDGIAKRDRGRQALAVGEVLELAHAGLLPAAVVADPQVGLDAERSARAPHL
jgi:hypothetical protein